MKPMNACIDCKHHDQEWCHRKNHFDLVKGKYVFVPEPCHDERRDGWFWTKLMNTCGKEGRFFERAIND